MDGGNEQRIVIKFCFKAGLSATETLVLVQKAYGKENWSNVFRCSRFREGRVLVEDDERGGLPKSSRNEVNIVAVVDLVKNDRRIPSRMTAESLNIPKTVVLRILKEGLGKRKLCSRFVPHSLTSEQREDRVTFRQDIIAMGDANINLLTNFLREIRPGVFPMTPKQNVRILDGLMRHPLGQRNWNSKGPSSRPGWIFFSTLKA